MLNFDNTGVTVTLDELLESGIRPFDFDYPVPRATIEYNGKVAQVPFNKATFEKKILDHYRFRQIGQETPGRWLHYFRTRIREIMPYYVQLYEFDAIFHNIEDPLESYTLKEEYSEETAGTGRVTGSSTGETSSENTSTGENTRKFSNTPQGSIDNLDKHLTEATKEGATDTETATSNASGSSEQSSEDNGSKTYTMTRRGNIGVQPLGGEVENIRHAFINIDQMVINELNDLFLLVY